ncbi:MAG: hypothetical protein QXY74_00910 [Candidatus Bathyarchaeia archaeon]
MFKENISAGGTITALFPAFTLGAVAIIHKKSKANVVMHFFTD